MTPEERKRLFRRAVARAVRYDAEANRKSEAQGYRERVRWAQAQPQYTSPHIGDIVMLRSGSCGLLVVDWTIDRHGSLWVVTSHRTKPGAVVELSFRPVMLALIQSAP